MLSKIFYSRVIIILLLLQFTTSFCANSHEITLCGERIPVDKDFVATKLMNVIRKQIPQVNMPALRQRCMTYFPIVQAYLINNNIPRDFMYLPIVESNFISRAQSGVGARGFWQFMPATAKDYGLIMNGVVDERDDIHKSTNAACKLLKTYYTQIAKKYKISSWILTTAAYNFGIGNVYKAIDRQGKDYFSMQLNAETAAYVYKLIAVKELFEYPELYMKNIGYNVFNPKAKTKAVSSSGSGDDVDFKNMTVKVSNKKKEKITQEPEDQLVTTYIAAHIKGKYKNFEDGDLISIQLDEDFSGADGFMKKKSVIKGYGWIIDDRIFVDLGFGHSVTVYDVAMQKGVLEKDLAKSEPNILLKNMVEASDWK
jgi:hypothetical protein